MNETLQLQPLFEEMNLQRGFTIAGPCSAESYEQLYQTAKALHRHGISIFRAGVWKPRTFPGAFEGVGTIGLKWLKEIKDKLKIKTAVEVANAEHTKLAIQYDVDLLWIGARSTANPFIIDEIGEIAAQHDIPILVKNPIAADLNIWKGALKRLNNKGVKRLGAIHRGFGGYENSPYRNAPRWRIPIALKQTYPHLPLLCDPSHISGKRELLYGISQEAMDRCFDGLFIESHINPDAAWSDAAQQLTPDDLDKMIRSLTIRACSIKHNDRLSHFRQLIDEMDSDLLHLLSSRMNLAMEIAKWKMEHNSTVVQMERYESMVTDRLKQANELGLPEKEIRELFETIHEISVKCQNELIKQFNSNKEENKSI